MTNMTTSAAAAAGLAPSAKPGKAELQAAAKQFEAIFLRQMISSMRSAKLGDDILGSSASDQFRDMADARVATSMSGQGSGLGIGQMLLQQFGGADK